MTSETRKAKQYAEHQDKKLDEALEETFPASDPPAQTDPSRSIIAPQERGKRRQKAASDVGRRRAGTRAGEAA